MKLFTDKVSPLLGYGFWLLLCLVVHQGFIILLNSLVPFGWYLPL